MKSKRIQIASSVCGGNASDTMLEARVFRNEANIDSLSSDVGDMANQFQGIGNDLDTIDFKVKDQDRRLMALEFGGNNSVEISSLTSRVMTNETRIADANTRLSILESSNSNSGGGNNSILDLSPITNRLGVAESNINTNMSKISNHDSRILDLEKTSGMVDIKPITNKVTKLENDVDTLEVDTQSFGVRLTALEAVNGGSVDIQDIKNRVSAVETVSRNNKTLINAVQTGMNTNIETITDHEVRLDILEREVGAGPTVDLAPINAQLQLHSQEINTLEMKVEILEAGGGAGGNDVDLSGIRQDISDLKVEDVAIKAAVQKNTADIAVLQAGGGGGGSYDDTEVRGLITAVDNKATNNAAQIATLAGQIGDLDSGATTFSALTDTPASMAGNGGRFVAVNGAGTALEYVNAPAGGGGGSYDDTALRAMITDLDNTKAESSDVTAIGTRLTQAENAIDALEAGGGGDGGGGSYDDTEVRGLITENRSSIDFIGGKVNDNKDQIDAVETRVNALEAGGGGDGGGAAITSATLEYPWYATSGNNASADTTRLETSSVMNCGTSGHNITLPLVKDIPDQVIRYVTTQHDCTVTCQGPDVIWMPKPGADAKTINLAAGECIALISYHQYNGWGRLFHVKA